MADSPNCYEIIPCDAHRDADDPWSTAVECADCQHVTVDYQTSDHDD